MHLTTLLVSLAVALTTASPAQTSPVFLLQSTAPFTLTSAEHTPDLPATTVQHVLWRHLSTCPTTHYLVVLEPQTLSHIEGTSFLPRAAVSDVSSNPSSPGVHAYQVETIHGSVNVVHVINTVLMDCLHHGVTKVKELDVDAEIPGLDARTVRESVLYVRVPEVDVEMEREEYVRVVEKRRAFVEGVVDRYFGGDYTLVYMREEMVEVDDGVRLGQDGKTEIPLVNDAL